MILILEFPRLSWVKKGRQIDDIHEQAIHGIAGTAGPVVLSPLLPSLHPTQAATVITYLRCYFFSPQPFASYSTLGTEYSYEKAGRDHHVRRTRHATDRARGGGARGICFPLAKCSTEGFRRHDPSACAVLVRSPLTRDYCTSSIATRRQLWTTANQPCQVGL